MNRRAEGGVDAFRINDTTSLAQSATRQAAYDYSNSPAWSGDASFVEHLGSNHALDVWAHAAGNRA